MGPRGRMPRGDGRKAKNVGKTLKRILSYVGKDYKFHIMIVFICIILYSFFDYNIFYSNITYLFLK